MFDLKDWIQLPTPYVPVQIKQPGDNCPLRFNPVWQASNVAELWGALAEIRSIFQEAHLSYPDTLWFRGQTSADHLLLPYIIRAYFDKDLNCSLPQYQRTLLEKFLARSQESPEISSTSTFKHGNEQIEHIADMQHYSVPTSLLDWSEDVSVPLYFATNGKGFRLPDAALYILHPYFYNFVRHEIIKIFQLPQENNSRNRDEIKKNLDTTDTLTSGLLPNISVNFNAIKERYEDYVVGPDWWAPLTSSSNWLDKDPLNEDLVQDCPAPRFPLAVQIPRGNIRIRKQSGTFMAFNLCEFPQKAPMEAGKKLESFRHIELQAIQDFYLKSQKLQDRIQNRNTPAYLAMKKRYPFLYKIVIKSAAIAPLRDVAAALGKREDTVYPELYKIGERIASEIV